LKDKNGNSKSGTSSDGELNGGQNFKRPKLVKN